MPAKLGFDRLGDRPFLKSKGSLLKLRHHSPFLRIAQIATLRATWTRGHFLGQICEIRAAIQPFDDLEGILFRLHENVSCPEFLARLELGDFLIIDFLQSIFVDRQADVLMVVGVVERAATVIFHPGLGVRALVHLVLLRGRREKLVLDKKKDEFAATPVWRDIRQLLTELALCDFHILFGDLGAIDGREHFALCTGGTHYDQRHAGGPEKCLEQGHVFIPFLLRRQAWNHLHTSCEKADMRLHTLFQPS